MGSRVFFKASKVKLVAVFWNSYLHFIDLISCQTSCQWPQPCLVAQRNKSTPSGTALATGVTGAPITNDQSISSFSS